MVVHNSKRIPLFCSFVSPKKFSCASQLYDGKHDDNISVSHPNIVIVTKEYIVPHNNGIVVPVSHASKTAMCNKFSRILRSYCRTAEFATMRPWTTSRAARVVTCSPSEIPNRAARIATCNKKNKLTNSGHWYQRSCVYGSTFMNGADFIQDVLATGDITRGDFLEAIANLLDRRVQVALMYGNRDYSGSCKLPLPIPIHEFPLILG